MLCSRTPRALLHLMALAMLCALVPARGMRSTVSTPITASTAGIYTKSSYRHRIPTRAPIEDRARTIYPQATGIPAVRGNGLNNTFWVEMLAQLERVIVEPNLELRNLQVTASYYQIGMSFLELTRTSGANGTVFFGNWAYFAVYASNSVGMSIREKTFQNLITEELQMFPPAVRKALGAILKLAPDFLVKIPAIKRALDVTALSLSGGNTAVFAEIGRAFCQYAILATAQPGPPPTAEWDSFIANVTKESAGHSPHLADAMENYYLAMYNATTDIERVQYIFMANTYTGFAEQTYLQSYIVGAFPAPVSVHIPWPINKNFTIDLAPMVTKAIMSLVLPEQILWLRDDVPPRAIDGLPWTSVMNTTSMQTYPTLYKMYIQLVGQSTSLKDTAATDWRNFAQRMRYILPLMRGRSNDPQLRCPPFSDSQIDGFFMTGTIPKESDFCLANCCQVNGNGTNPIMF